jgi:putative ABC transport system permease protein
VESAFPAFLKTHLPPYPGHTTELRLQPLTDIHFNTEYRDQYPRKAHLPTLYALMGIAAFILVIAAINFINLSTALSLRRVKEIGVRKVLGGGRLGLRVQFLLETGLLVTIAVLVSIPLAYPLLSFFHSLLPPGLRLTPLEPSVVLFLLGLAIATTVLAGFYPARILSAYQPALSLKGQGAVALNRNGLLRKALIVFQFTISLVFIISAAIIGSQVHYMLNKDLGFRKDAVITMRPAWHDPAEKLALFARQVGQLAAVTEWTTHMETPAAKSHSNTWLMRRDAPVFKEAAAYEMCDDKYLHLFGITLLAGRNLGHSDTIRDFLINETMMHALGFHRPEDAIGKAVEDGNDATGYIVGVVRDFNAQSLHERVMPFYLSSKKDWEKAISIRLATQDHSVADFTATIARIEKIWKTIYPDERFDYSFFDQSIERLYRSELNSSRLMDAAMCIAIFISCTGLFGLATFMAGQRTKEIAIRKTLGAGVGQILALLNGDLVLLVGIAVLIASPVAWYAMHRWLSDFAYRIPVSGWFFAAAALATLALALITTSYQTIKAARANPIEGLRTE